MGDMFGSCKSLKNLDVSHFDTSKVKNMSYVFNYCYSLKNIDLTKWILIKHKYALYFDNCTNLTSIKVSKQTSEKMNNFVTKFKTSYIDYIGTTSDKFIVSDKWFYNIFILCYTILNQYGIFLRNFIQNGIIPEEESEN